MKKWLLCLALLINNCYHTASARLDYAFNYNNQRAMNFIMRLNAANIATLQQPNYDITSENNGEATPANSYAPAFSKVLEHDATTGLLNSSGIANFQQLLTAINSTLQADYNAITLAPGSVRKLVNPQAACAMSLIGVPNTLIPMPTFPLISSAQAAALLIEVYLQAICRDVEFKDYGTGANTDVDTINGGSITNNAAAILTALGNNYTGPKVGGVVTAATLFRGSSAGDLVGPYISQFLYADVPQEFQLTVSFKPYVDIASNKEFGVSWADFIAIQNGQIPQPYTNADFSGQHYIIRGRDAATIVHSDGPGEICFYAANILMKNNFPGSPVFPYLNGNITKEEPFVTMAIGDIYTALFGACLEALKHAWAHKWRGNRVLRPEAFAGHVHRVEVTGTNPLNLDGSLFATYGGIDFLEWVKAYNTIQQTATVHDPLTPPDAETYLLSQVFPEGSPVHPSYPAGHAVLAGAIPTILKAFFDDQALIKDYMQPVKPDPSDPTKLVDLPSGEGANVLTVAGELDKLASNIAISRNFAGVHYRNDGEEGILLGEQVAIYYLRDIANIYAEQGFTGFVLTKRNGERIRITATNITVI